MSIKPDIKILFVIPKSDLPSSFIFSKRQAEDIKHFGYNVEIFYLDTKISFFNLIREYLRLKKMVKIFNPNLIHSHYGTITSFICSKIKNIPLIITFQGSDLNYTKDITWIREKIGKYLSKISAKKAKKIICVSESLLTHLKTHRNKAIVIPVGVDISIFKELNMSECKKKLGLFELTNYIFFNSNNPKVKRLDIAEKVVKNLENYNFKLLSLSGIINPSEVPFYLNSCLLVLLCSDSEGSPMIIKEAMACNIPIVSVDVGDVKLRLTNVKNCFIVKQDVREITEKIKYIYENKLFKSNGKLKIIEDKIDSISTTNKLVSIYQEMLNLND
ncbi:MAG: glycosyltransferase family 4 protein [Flavobacteriia bacterium]|nr:glycosyltransferase family 4 protein [Flavobacteriia bacterium]